ncbi:MAG: phospholipid carrier-dependent glycosyltransferase [Nocardioidaceae bacterium]|nr:phospholipid carrier-dependent glycosyltransferase [Nocardioidaceae bacterium]MCL2613266.1 phospholipid carrier-dependent glycosyltransferase [Nocardioidaceae bacterium]
MTAVDDKLESLSTTSDGERLPTARERAINPITTMPWRQKAIGWLAPIGLTLLAFGLRVWHLGTPRIFAFDETYYAKDAWSLLNNGYLLSYKADADGNPKTDINADILAGHVHGVWTKIPELGVHPDVGKWMIAVGEHFWGMNPFGWRIASAVVGSLMVLVMARMVRRMTGSTVIGCAAGALLMLDGLQFVLSRLALLDIFLGFWLLCSIACLVADRDWHRSRLARDRRVWFRPWLVGAGICFGLACGSKWDAVYPLAAFGILCVVWSIGARRSMRMSRWLLKGVLVDGVPAFCYLVLVALVVYVATWAGWIAHARSYEEHLSSTQYRQYTGQGHCTGTGSNRTYTATDLDPNRKWPTAITPKEHRPGGLVGFVRSLRSLWYYHQDVYTFHTHFLNCSTHFYQSNPSGWLLLNRPVGVAVTNDIKPGTDGCEAPADSSCIRQVLLLGNPVVWWGGCLALLFALVMWVGTRDWRYGVAIVGTLSTWLPWFHFDSRPIFIFYAIATLPFVVLALALAMGHLIGPSQQPSRRRTTGVVVSGAYVVLALVAFAWFWPIYTNQLITHSEWLDRIWFSRWV